ncbi:hypothetical protein ACGYKC_18770, partial [Sulfitobacter sp. CS16]
YPQVRLLLENSSLSNERNRYGSRLRSTEYHRTTQDRTRRQVSRLLKRYRADGAASIRRQSRGMIPNNQIHQTKRAFALTLIKESYADFGPTFAAEMLTAHHDFKVSAETVRQWMIQDGIWLSRKKRRAIHPPRSRRECFGELI